MSPKLTDDELREMSPEELKKHAPWRNAEQEKISPAVTQDEFERAFVSYCRQWVSVDPVGSHFAKGAGHPPAGISLHYPPTLVGDWVMSFVIARVPRLSSRPTRR